MRQEPSPQKPLWAIIGIGRLGRCLQHQLEYHGQIVEPLRSADSSERVLKVLEASDRILLCLPDRQIAPFLNRYHEMFSEKPWIHFAASVFDPRAVRAHPMWSFTGEILPSEIFERIPFALDRESPSLTELFPTFRNPELRIAREDFPLYHALCVIGASLPVLTWAKLEEVFSRHLNLSPEHLRNYAQGIARNYQNLGLQALTGPWVRADQGTIEKNLLSLAAYPTLLEFYRMGLMAAQKPKRQERSSDALA